MGQQGRRVRPLAMRAEELRRKLDKVELQMKIVELRARIGRSPARRRLK